jgi:hypothetical protein
MPWGHAFVKGLSGRHAWSTQGIHGQKNSAHAFGGGWLVKKCTGHFFIMRAKKIVL